MMRGKGPVPAPAAAALSLALRAGPSPKQHGGGTEARFARGSRGAASIYVACRGGAAARPPCSPRRQTSC